MRAAGAGDGGGGVRAGRAHRLMRCVSVELCVVRQGSFLFRFQHPDSADVILSSSDRGKYRIGDEYWITFVEHPVAVEPASGWQA